jgi:hypothetical protein
MPIDKGRWMHLAWFTVMFAASAAFGADEGSSTAAFRALPSSSPAFGRIVGWRETEVPVKIITTSPRLEAVARVEGSVNVTGWALMWDEDLVVGARKGAPAGSFTMPVSLNGPDTLLRLRLIGPRGERVEGNFSLHFAPWERITEESSQRPERSQSILASVGLTSVSYSETLWGQLRETLVSAKLAVARDLPWTSWQAGGNVYVNAVVVGSSKTGAAVRFLGANARIGRRFSLGGPWQLAIQAGAYYVTTIATTSNAGFRNLVGPQLYPSLRRSLSFRDQLAVYLKYSPVLNGSTLTFTSRELAAGVAWTRDGLLGGRALVTSLDFARLHIAIRNAFFIDVTTVTLGAGIEW